MTLRRFIVACFVALAAMLAVLLTVFSRASERTLLVASERLMAQASRRVTERLEQQLGEAEQLVATVEGQLAMGASLAPDALEPMLLGALFAHPAVTEVTFTYGRALGTYTADDVDADHDPGELRLAPDGRGQLSLARDTSDADVLVRRVAPAADGAWTARVRNVRSGATPPAAGPPPLDPTLHATFTVPSRPEYRGRALWSDLAFAEADSALPPDARRRVVSLQKALWSPDGTFLGVLRVARQSDRIDEVVRIRVDEDDPSTPDEHVVFIADRAGRLVSRLSPADRFVLLDRAGAPDEYGDVRVAPAAPPPAVTAALRSDALHALPAAGQTLARLDVDGEPYLLTLTGLLGDRSQDWVVGIVVPEAHYLRDLAASRRRVLALAAALMLAAIVGGAIVLRAIRGDLDRLIGETTRLRGFDFAPAGGGRAAFGDVQEAADGLEQAKTALRALGKYAPLDLVRELWEARLEPELGGRLQDVTMLFSDVEGFTTVSERLDPDTLAEALGAYLETVTRAIHATGGIIDKYAGDGVMALWNTPRPCAAHATRACEAALACTEAAARLFASPAWAGRAPWRTRIGLHRAEVTVGHFGAPDRMSFTAMGDGVNLAARLEGLNKQYGTLLMASAAVVAEAGAAFLFRRLDRVAVKGKREGVEVFELLGRRTPEAARPMAVERYEQALAAYFARDFLGALNLLRGARDDAPSRVLAARCTRYLADPPPADWDGVWVAQEK